MWSATHTQRIFLKDGRAPTTFPSFHFTPTCDFQFNQTSRDKISRTQVVINSYQFSDSFLNKPDKILVIALCCFQNFLVKHIFEAVFQHTFLSKNVVKRTTLEKVLLSMEKNLSITAILEHSKVAIQDRHTLRAENFSAKNNLFFLIHYSGNYLHSSFNTASSNMFHLQSNSVAHQSIAYCAADRMVASRWIRRDK